MRDRVRALLEEQNGDAAAWLREHLPRRSDPFLSAIRDEAQQLEREDPREALHAAALAHTAAELWQDRQVEALALHLDANARLLLAEPGPSLERFRRAAAIYRELEMPLEEARVAVGQLGALLFLGRHDEALHLASQAAAVFEREGEEMALGKVLLNQGTSYSRQHRFAEARQAYGRARALFSRLDVPHLLAMVDVNEAIVLTELDDFQQAERLLQRARAYFDEQGMNGVVAQVDHNMAYLYLNQGDYQQALRTFNQARANFRLLDNQVEVANVDLLRSDIYLALNLWQEALEQIESARPIFEEAAMILEQARLHLNEAAVQSRIPPYSSYQEPLEKARELFEEEQNETWLAMADLYEATFARRTGNLKMVQSQVRRAEAVFAAQGLFSRGAQCQIILGEAALQERRLTDAEVHFSTGLAYLKNGKMPAISYRCFYGLGRVQQKKGWNEQALDSYRHAIEDLERLQAAIGAEDYKMAFLADKLEVYESLVFLCLEIGTAEALREAFSTVERTRTRALLDAMLREPPVEADDSPSAELMREIERLRRELTWYYNRLNRLPGEEDAGGMRDVEQLTHAVSEREEKLARLFRRWHDPDLVTAPRNPIWTVTPAQIAQALPERTDLLSYYLARNRLVIFGLSDGQVWSEERDVSEEQLAPLLSQFRFQINKFNYGRAYRERHAEILRRGANDVLQQLYELLLAPVAERLTGERLVIVPHGLLHYVPFQALWDGSHYLIDRTTISYAPSATILYRTLNATPPATGRPLVLGIDDPTIPHAQSEAEAIGALFPDADLRVGTDATSDHLSRRSHLPPAFLHLSTHATFRSDNPLFSSLKLADRWVSVNDIYGMNLPAPLVTLSACETGRNHVAVGDELVGLCRGFFAGGAQSLVLSLWRVEDDSTAALMTDFYRQLQDGRPVNEALRAAQLAAKASCAHPYYWASFILTGALSVQLHNN